MIKKNVIEFLFNDKKYKVEKFVLLIMYWLVVLYLTTAFQVSLTFLIALVLMILVVLYIIKIAWYNKKQNIKTRVMDKMGIILCMVVTAWALFLYVDEKKLENAVYDVLEEKVGRDTFSIEFIDEMKNKENYIAVGYTIEGEDTMYLEWYYYRDVELIHDLTREIEDDKE